MNMRKRSWISMTLAVGVLLSACAGDTPPEGQDEDEVSTDDQAEAGDEEESTGDAGEAYDQGADADTIKIGMFAPLSGSAAVFGKGLHTIESMYRELNEAGGINGRQVELVIEDSQCDPATLRLAVTRLIEREEVFMLHGGMCSNAVLNVLPEIEDTGIPTLIMGAASTQIADPPKENVFIGWVDQTGGTRMNAELVVSHAQETGSSTVALVAHGDEWGDGWAEGFEEDLASVSEEVGIEIEIVTRDEIQEETGDATAQVNAIASSGADVAVVYAYPQPMSVLLRDAYAQGLETPIFTGQGTFAEDQLERVGNRDAVEGFFSAFCLGAAFQDPGLDVYREALAKYYPDDVFDASAMLGVSGFDLNVEILSQMGDNLTWDNWIATAESIPGLETAAAPGPIGFGPFDEADPSTRRAADSCNAATINPDEAAESEVLVLAPDWSEWQSVRQEAG